MGYEIDLSGVSGREELHARLRAALPLPDWYGNNLDALRDVLTESGGGWDIRFRNAGRASESAADYIAVLRRMCADAAAETPGLTIAWEDDENDMLLDHAKRLRADTARHYNCAQSVLVPFAQAAGIDEETAFRVAANFGGGMKRASVCGAVTGGLMALGLLGIDDGPTVAEYHRRLRQAHDGMLDCKDLLRVNQEQGGDRAAHCDGMVYECLELVEELARRAGKL